MTQPLRIAVADDEPLMRRWFESTLTKLGHQVVVSASNGEEVVQQLRVTNEPHDKPLCLSLALFS